MLPFDDKCANGAARFRYDGIDQSSKSMSQTPGFGSALASLNRATLDLIRLNLQAVRAVKWHSDHQVLTNMHKTVIFR
jgi:hypothetical protein